VIYLRKIASIEGSVSDEVNDFVVEAARRDAVDISAKV
jgi:hypothetical protein